jgi:trimethylamine:corrinoid methyltransferase-like protein
MNKKPLQAKPACQICGCDKRCDLHRGVFVRPVVADLIRQDFGRWAEEGWICSQDMQRYRHKYVEHLLQEEQGEISSLEREVI